MNEQVLEKLKKILRLADNSAATKGEVEAAMARAKEIAMQHDIDLSTINFEDPAAKAKSFDIEKGTVGFGSSREYPYHRWITHVLKEVFGVYVVRLGAGYAFIGDKNDVAVCKELFPWMESIYRNSFQAKVKAGLLYQSAGDRNGFYRGFTAGLLEANRKVVAETLSKQNVDKNKYAMVLRNKETAIEAAVPGFFPNLRDARKSATRVNYSAFNTGHAEGKKVNLNQVGGGVAKNRLN